MGEETGKECDKLAFMTEGDSREASLLRDLAMPDLLQQAFHEVHQAQLIVTVFNSKLFTRYISSNFCCSDQFFTAGFFRGTVHHPDFLLQ